jgi:ubiquinone/menaquinone biosynthesis C-methylase UbiE
MVTQYDAIADHYRRAKHSPLREYIEAYTFLELIGDVRGKAVLDLACGEGYYTRRLNRLGAGPVVGVDISSAMIDLAAAEERTRPLGIRYVCADVAEMPALGQFDLVVAAYLLHYARDADELLRMAHNIARHLAPGGRFVTLNENPSQPPERYRGYDQYGFNKTRRAVTGQSSLTEWSPAGSCSVSTSTISAARPMSGYSHGQVSAHGTGIQSGWIRRYLLK